MATGAASSVGMVGKKLSDDRMVRGDEQVHQMRKMLRQVVMV